MIDRWRGVYVVWVMWPCANILSPHHVSRIKDHSVHAVRGLGSGHFLLSLRYGTDNSHSQHIQSEGDTGPHDTYPVIRPWPGKSDIASGGVVLYDRHIRPVLQRKLG